MSKKIIDDKKFFDRKVYDDYFEDKVRLKGYGYYTEDKISDFVSKDNEFSCKIQGTDEYKVSVVFDKSDDKKIASANCTCPYYLENNKYCKHIYALVLKSKCDSNCNILRKKLEEEIKDIKEEISIAKMYLVKLGINFNDKRVKYYFEYLDGLSKRLDMFYAKLDNYKRDENTYIYMLEALEKDYNELLKKTQELADNFEDIIVKKENKSNGLVSLLNGIANGINSVFKPFYDLDEEKANIRKKKLEEEMEDYNLDENEKELVREGLYDPWDFEMDDPLEDDDYYDDFD